MRLRVYAIIITPMLSNEPTLSHTDLCSHFRTSHRPPTQLLCSFAGPGDLSSFRLLALSSNHAEQAVVTSMNLPHGSFVFSTSRLQRKLSAPDLVPWHVHRASPVRGAQISCARAQWLGSGIPPLPW